MESIVSRTINLFLATCLLFSIVCSITNAQWYPKCYTTSNYTQGSPYQSNLNLTLTSLASNITPTGFNTATFGTKPTEDVYGQLQCRGDISNDECGSCAKNISLEIVKRCPDSKEAVIFEDKCMLHYADTNFFSVASTTPAITLVNSAKENSARFNSVVGDLMQNLSTKAASDVSKFSTGRTNFSDSNSIYGLVQCSRDLSGKSCLKCLKGMIGQIPACCAGNQGARVLSTTCSIRYEIYSFFESSSSPSPALPPGVSSPGSPSPAPPPVISSPGPPSTAPPPVINSPGPTKSDGGGKERNPRNVIIGIIIPTIIASVLIP